MHIHTPDSTRHPAFDDPTFRRNPDQLAQAARRLQARVLGQEFVSAIRQLVGMDQDHGISRRAPGTC